MKISANQLDMALARIKNIVNGYAKSNEDLVVEVEFTTADPGSGQMVDTLTLTATGPVEGDKEERETKVIIEVYPDSEKQEPRATKIDSFTVKNKYG